MDEDRDPYDLLRPKNPPKPKPKKPKPTIPGLLPHHAYKPYEPKNITLGEICSEMVREVVCWIIGLVLWGGWILLVLAIPTLLGLLILEWIGIIDVF